MGYKVGDKVRIIACYRDSLKCPQTARKFVVVGTDNFGAVQIVQADGDKMLVWSGLVDPHVLIDGWDPKAGDHATYVCPGPIALDVEIITVLDNGQVEVRTLGTNKFAIDPFHLSHMPADES